MINAVSKRKDNTMHNHPTYLSWVSHVEDQAEAQAIINALLSCFVASSLASLIAEGSTTHENAIVAYRKKFSVKNKALTISDFVREESEFCQRFDI